jgi:hypothetical protein
MAPTRTKDSPVGTVDLDTILEAVSRHQSSCGYCDTHTVCERGVGYVMGVIDTSIVATREMVTLRVA